MIQKLGQKLCDLAEKYMPEPFTLATILSFVVFGLAIFCTETTTTQAVEHWYKDFWSFLPFSMQMCMILVTGYALSTTKPIKKMIQKVAQYPQNTSQAAFVISFVAIFLGLINWGLGLIVGAFLAREVAIQGQQKNIRLHYPILGAAGYMGMVVWHGGMSGSAPLLIATKGHFLESTMGILPVSDTVFSSLNIITCVFLLSAIPTLFAFLAPKREEEIIDISSFVPCKEEEQKTILLGKDSLLGILLGFCGCFYVVHHLYIQQRAFDLNILNFSFLFLGILLHHNLRNYYQAIATGVKSCSGIILLFPFYAGIKGIMVHSGLAQEIAHTFASIANTTTLPLYTFFSAGIINFFIPSGGGQWIVQGEIVIQSSQQLDIPTHKAVLAFCYGDQWTNLLQPFWALALLDITGLKAKDIMGYCIAIMLLGIPVFLTFLLFL